MAFDVPDRMRLHLALVAWRTQGAQSGWCYTESVRKLAAEHDVTHECWSGDAMLERTRSAFLTRFHQGATGDVLIWIDSDMVWRTDDVARLARSAYKTHGIVGAVYPKRRFGGGVTARFCRDGAPKSVNIGDDLLLPAELVGAGFMAIHRDALDHIARTLPWVHDDANGDWQPFCKTELIAEDDCRMHFAAEDEALCLRARHCGVPVMCDVAVVLGHQGEHVFTVADGERKG